IYTAVSPSTPWPVGASAVRRDGRRSSAGFAGPISDCSPWTRAPLRVPHERVGEKARAPVSTCSSAGFAGATLSWGEVSEGAVEAPSDSPSRACRRKAMPSRFERRLCGAIDLLGGGFGRGAKPPFRGSYGDSTQKRKKSGRSGE